MTSAPTKNHLSALKWFFARGGDGVFEKNRQVLVAAGERAPAMRSTWNALAGLGLVEFYAENRRLRITHAGFATDLSKVKESS